MQGNISDFGPLFEKDRPQTSEARLTPIAPQGAPSTGDTIPPAKWKVYGPGSYGVSGPTLDTLPAGAYAFAVDPHGELQVLKKTLDTDALIDFPSSIPHKVIEDTEKFASRGAH